LKVQNLLILKIGDKHKSLYKANKRNTTNQLTFQYMKSLKGMTYEVLMVMILLGQLEIKEDVGLAMLLVLFRLLSQG